MEFDGHAYKGDPLILEETFNGCIHLNMPKVYKYFTVFLRPVALRVRISSSRIVWGELKHE